MGKHAMSSLACLHRVLRLSLFAAMSTDSEKKEEKTASNNPRVFFDITIGQQNAGRIVMELYKVLVDLAAAACAAPNIRVRRASAL